MPIPGKCTTQGTQRFKERAIKQQIPAKNFRKTYPLPSSNGLV